MFDRWYAKPLLEKLGRPFVHVMFGARQTGKTTLLKALLPPETLHIDLSDPAERARHLARPGEFAAICRTLPAGRKIQFVFVDEVQSVPSILDAVQHLYDGDKTRWRFVLCGSSARKLRRTGANLLSGRSFLHHLYPLVLWEQPSPRPMPNPFPSIVAFGSAGEAPQNPFPAWELPERLAYGSLPGIVAAEARDRPDLLRGFALIHLEEEIRREALVRDWGGFVRFLQFAAIGSGQPLNYAAVSQETGVSQPTVKAYYQLLEDLFVGFRIPAYTKSSRRSLLSTPKFLFFDLGVWHAAAGMAPSPEIVQANPGAVFEQWVGIELWKRLRYSGEGALFHQRSKDGAKVDYVVERAGRAIPIEVKWTENPTLRDARHLLRFLDDHPRQKAHGYVVCRCPRPLALDDRVTALPWWAL